MKGTEPESPGEWSHGQMAERAPIARKTRVGKAINTRKSADSSAAVPAMSEGSMEPHPSPCRITDHVPGQQPGRHRRPMRRGGPHR
jgi:hypothetical protein